MSDVETGHCFTTRESSEGEDCAFLCEVSTETFNGVDRDCHCKLKSYQI